MVTMASNESVYALIPAAQHVPEKPAMHKSGFIGKTLPHQFEFGGSTQKGHATMGLPNGANARNPGSPMRAHEKEPHLPAPSPPTVSKTKLRPAVPTKDEKPVMGLTSNKNFITANAVEAILAKPKNVPQEEFQWTMKPDYGKVPMYLRRNKARVAAEREHVEQYLKLREEPSASAHVSQLAADDRAQLLRHLKLKWQTLNTAYQALSLCVDTAIKKGKKEAMERQLAEVEKDIKTLERGEVVLVVED